MEPIWRDAPVAALRVWDREGASRFEVNPVARCWAARHELDDADWATLLERCAGRKESRFEVELHHLVHRLRVTRVALDDGWLLWIEPQDALGGEAAGERLDLLEEVGRMGVAVRDLDTGRGHWDGQVFRLFGIDETAPTPTLPQVLDRVHPDDRAEVQSYLAALPAPPRRGELRFRIVRPDGAVRHVHSIHETRARPGAARGLLVDVLIDDTDSVERIAAERRIAEFLDRALVLAEVSVWRVDLTTQLVHFNSVGIRLTDIELDEVGVPLAELRSTIHPDDLDAVLRAADEAIASHKVIDVVARYRNRQGGWSTLLTRRVADRDSEGRAVALAGISIDLTAQIAERDRAAALQQQKRRADQARRDQAAFLSRMSHELRTPMNAVLGFARLMAEDRADVLSARQQQRLEHIREAGQQLLSLTDGLLEMTAREQAAREGENSAPAPLQDGAASGAGPASEAAKRLTLVCVEDNPVNMLLVRELLALRPQVELHCAADGLSGVDLAMRVRPQVMLLDLQLPDIGGHEVMHRVRHGLGAGGCTFIALSANAMPEHIEDMLGQGFDQYWTKPIDFSKFLGGIDTLIRSGGAPAAST